MEVDEDSQHEGSSDDLDEGIILSNRPDIDTVAAVRQCCLVLQTADAAASKMSTRDNVYADPKAFPNLDLSETIHHLNVAQSTWKACMETYLSEPDRTYEAGLEIFKLTHSVLTYSQKIKTSVWDTLVRDRLESKLRTLPSYLSSDCVSVMTRLYCEVILDLQRDNMLALVEIVLESFLDVVDVLMQGLGQGLVIGCDLAQDWMFILSLPWCSRLADNIPCCVTVPLLNSLRFSELRIGEPTSARCLRAFRFEIFYAFNQSIQLILHEILLESSKPLLLQATMSLISGLHWPMLLFDWQTVLTFCSHVVFNCEMDKSVSLTVAEAVVRLPCFYAARTYLKCIAETTRQDSLFYPPPRLCPLCDNFKGVFVPFDVGHKSVVRKVKLTQEDTACLQIMLLKMLSTCSVSVHVRLANVIRTLRYHSNCGAPQLTNLFCKMMDATTVSVRGLMTNIFGKAMREAKRVKELRQAVRLSTVRSRSSALPTNVSQSYDSELMNSNDVDSDIEIIEDGNDANSHGSSHERKSQQREMNGHCDDATLFKRKNKENEYLPSSNKKMRLAPLRDIRQRILKNASCGRNLRIRIGNTDGYDPESTSCGTQRHILTKTKVAPNPPPISSRFDCGDYLFGWLMSRLYAERSFQTDDLQKWQLMTKYHVVLKTLALYTDAEVFTPEILRSCVHLIGRIDSRFVTVLVHATFHLLSQRAGCSPEELLGKYREVIANEIRHVCLSYASCNRLSSDSALVLQKSEDFFRRICASADFAKRPMHEILLRLCLKRCALRMFDDESENLIVASIAKFLTEPISKFMQTEFAYYCPYVLVHSAHDQDRNKFLHLLKQKHKFDPAVACRLNSMWVHIEMLSLVAERKNEVIKQYERIIEWHEEGKKIGQSRHTSRRVAKILDTKAVGVLIAFHKKFLSRAESVTSKRKYLLCLGMLIGIMGQRIGQLKFKIYSTLNELSDLGSKHHDLLTVTWGVFLKNLDATSLKQIANQIFAAMYAFRRSNKAEFEQLINELVLQPDSPLQPLIHRLYYLDRFCASEDTAETILSLANTPREATASKLFHQLTEDIGHENSHVRFLAAKKMQQLLRREFLDLEDVTYDNRTFSSHTTKLLRNLLLASKQANDGMKVICASCLGILGALDPRRFDLREQLTANARLGLTSFVVGERHFKIYFIEELARILQGSNDAAKFDDCAYTIQELIRFFEITDSPEDEVWPQLTTKAKDLIDPLRTSKYNYKPNNINPNVLPCPLFGSTYAKNFTNWMFHWVIRMIENVKTESVKSFFKIASLVVQRSDQAGLALLPYVASYAVMEGAEDGLKTVFGEVTAILGNWMTRAIDMHDPEFKPKMPVQVEEFHSSFSIQPDNMVCSGENSSNSVANFQDSQELAFCATQTVFKVLDHFDRIIRNPRVDLRRRELDMTASQRVEKANASKKFTSEDSKPIKDLQARLCYDTLAKAAFECHNFARALMYMEQYIKESQNGADAVSMNMLQKTYVALYDEDSVKGVTTLKKDTDSVLDDVLNKICQGQLEDCTSLLEVVLSSSPNDLMYNQLLIYAYLALSQHVTSDLLLNGAVYRNATWQRSFDEAKLEIHLKQREFDLLAKKVNQMACDKLVTWGVSMGESLYAFNKADFSAVKSGLKKAKISLISSISSAVSVLDMGFYFRHYKDLIRFQLMTELEEATNLVSAKTSLSTDFENLSNLWHLRLQGIHKSPEILRSVLSFRKTVLEIAKDHYSCSKDIFDVIDAGVRNCSIKLAQLEAEVGNHNRANQWLLESKISCVSNIFYDEAKMLADAGKYEECLKVVERGLKLNHDKILRMQTSDVNDTVTNEQETLSKACLLFAQQMDNQRKADVNTNIINYKLAISINKRSEDNYFHLACYCDRWWSQSENRSKQSNLLIMMVENYSASLEFGCSHVFQSLPRVLTMWFDYASEDPRISSSQKSSPNPDIVEKLTDNIRKLLERAPAYIFIVAFSQLISRLTHTNHTVYHQLRDILMYMIMKHPQQVLWMIMGVLRSTNKIRLTRCNEIFSTLKQRDRNLQPMVTSYKQLADKLIQFTMAKCDKVRFIQVSNILPELPLLISSPTFAEVLIPFQEFMKPQLPRGGKYLDRYNPFSSSAVHISKISEPVQLMCSLQRPKKVCLIGSNGKQYSLLCKPSDDLRKDGKLMEINNMVQWYLSQEKEAVKRNLIIRTYYVIPLCDDCGLIEWIPNLHPFRNLVTGLYKEGYGVRAPPRVDRHMIPDRKDDDRKKRRIFDELMEKFPPVLSYWFLKVFPEPQTWYAARNSFVRTAAVMSIVGFLMGLGDRHGENILLDASNGDCVHVDFNCLFNKGETFDWPERVPFRLTQNMIDAMGPLKYEGPFRRCCEIVMRIIRNNSSVFLSIVRPFVFDPLQEWDSNTVVHRRQRTDGEISSVKAVEHLNNIRDRLLGTARNFKKDRNVALSVEAHVKHLIDEATSFDNLCQMFPGWAAHL